MDKTFILLILIIIFSSCGTEPNKNSKANDLTPVSKYPKEQQRIFDKKNEANEAYSNARNEMQKNEIQSQFDNWLKSYLKDTLNGKISNFYVTINELKSGQLSDFYYIFVDFKTEDKLHLYREEDVKTEAILKNTSLYKKVHNASENQNVYLTAKFIELKDYNFQDKEYSSINYPRIYISVDTIKGRLDK